MEKPPVIGILAQSGLHFFITILSLGRLGYTTFLISTRLASPAIHQLCDVTGCNAVLTTPAFHPVLAEVQEKRSTGLTVLPLMMHSDYYGKDSPRFIRHYDPSIETDRVIVIIHSSGSTGFPKPIYLTNRSCIGAFSTNIGLRSLLTSPMFHNHGFAEIFRSIYAKKPIYLCNYNIPLTKEALIQMIGAAKPDLLHCVPYVIKLLAETQAGIEALAGVKLVLYAGSGCPDDLGDYLVKERGVYLVGNYGS